MNTIDGYLLPASDKQSPEPLFLKFFCMYGKIYHIQNLAWSELFLEQSCADELRKKVLEITMNILEIEKGGPLYFKVMMIIIISNTGEAICALTSRLSAFKVSSIQGENISKAVSQLRGDYFRLIIPNKVPQDISHYLTNIFRNTSVNEFNSIFKTMKYIIVVENRNFAPEDILHIAGLAYKEMAESGLWIAH